MVAFLWYLFRCTYILNLLFCICSFTAEIQRVLFSLGGFLGEAVRVDEALSEKIIPIGGDLFLKCMQRRTRIWNQGLMLSSSINFAARIASKTHSFGKIKSNFTVFSSRVSSSAPTTAMLQSEWCYCVAKFLVNVCVKAILTQVSGMTETLLMKNYLRAFSNINMLKI